MHESPADLIACQRLLDDSYAGAGTHLRRVVTPDRRLSAEQVVARLQGVCLLVLATVTADGRPVTGPVDGVFYRGSFHFGSAPDSVRFRHLRRRPRVSATHLPGEELSVTVHGRAVPVDVAAPAHRGFRDTLVEIYVPRYGDDWTRMLEGGAVFARIEAERMFTFNGEGLA